MTRTLSLIAVSIVIASLVAAQTKRGKAKHHATAPNASAGPELENIEHTWADSEVKHDSSRIAPYLAETFIETDPDGNLTGRQDVLDGIAKGDPTLKEVELAEMKTQSYGDAAVITGRYTEHREANGKHNMISGRFTDTYVKRDGKWECVASHNSVAAH